MLFSSSRANVMGLGRGMTNAALPDRRRGAVSWPALSITEPMVRAPSPRQPDTAYPRALVRREIRGARPCSSVAPCPSLSTRPAPGPPCSPTSSYDVSPGPDRPGDLRRAGPSVRFDCAEPGADTFLELTDALDLAVAGAKEWSYDGRRIHARRPRGEQRRPGRGPAPLRHRRRRDAHVHRPGRRRDLRVGVRRHGHRPAGLPLLRPERPQGPDHAAGHGARGLDGARQRPGGRRARAALWRFDHDPADPDADVRRLRRSVALGDVGARRPDGRTLPFGWHARSVAGRRARP